MFEIIKDLYFTRRDLVSDGYDESLEYLSKIIPLKIHSFSSGTKCWTWIVPKKWSINDAYIEVDGKKLLDLKDHPLHVISYSLPVDKIISHKELMDHLHSNPNRPNSIPFQFKYYEQDWGFCIEHNKLSNFCHNQYHVLIDSHFDDGSLKVGEVFIKGKSEETIVIVAHLDHPAMANDDLAGVAVLTGIANSLLEKKHLKYSYKLLILPETIGSIAYLSQNENIIPNLKFGIFLEMLGNDNEFALQFSRQSDTILDKIAKNIIKTNHPNFSQGEFREVVANDEMVFNGPGVNIPMISISRWPYPEYHTNDDDISIIKSEKLEESKSIILEILESLEENYFPKRKFIGPPFLSGYGLWVDWQDNLKQNLLVEKIFMEFEGNKSIIEIADQFDLPFKKLLDYVNKFVDAGLVEKKFS
jgi:aminopeptidase-like protein